MRSFKIQDGDRRHLGFQKTAAISLLIDRSSFNLEQTLRRYGCHFFTIRPIFTKVNRNIAILI